MKKNILIEVPRHGASVHLVLRAGASSGQAVIVVDDDVEVRLAEPAPAAAPHPATPAATNTGKAPATRALAHDLDAIFKRLTKLKPTKRAAALNCIKTMFPVTAPISDAEAHQILEALRRRGNLTIFARDGIWEAAGVGYAQGPAELRTLFKSFAERISFSQHHVFNPRITVTGTEAHGSWYFLGPFTFRKDQRQIWIAARYEDDYIKVEGTWKFKHLHAFNRMLAPYEEGWEVRSKVDVFTT